MPRSRCNKAPALDVTDCPTCSGEGVLDCLHCHGSGGGLYYPCPYCSGMGSVGPCDRCEGSGLVPSVKVCAFCGHGAHDNLLAVAVLGVCQPCLDAALKQAGTP